ncbi:MAG: hypothetical protein LBM87_02770 [Ruminococcus sp.]|nr:hypothetical protein [Ruminococcus sp.]
MLLLNDLLTGKDCAECRLCCWFTKYDLWETPVLTDNLREYITDNYPGVRMTKRPNGEPGSLFIMEETSEFVVFEDEEITRYNCPMLTENGCILGDNKPFECAIWPYRIMHKNGVYFISLSTLCKPILDNSMKSLLSKLTTGGLKQQIVEYARENPCIIKEYKDGYPILMILSEQDLLKF